MAMSLRANEGASLQLLTMGAAAASSLYLYFTRPVQQAIRCVIFDLDDTLWDTAGVLNRATRMFHQHLAAAYPRLGERFPRSEYLKVYNVYKGSSANWTEIRTMCLRHCARATGYDEDKVAESGLRVFEEYRNDVEPFVFPGVRQMLKSLKSKGYIVGSVSNGTADVRNINYFKGLFEFHFCPADSGVRKPDPTMFHMALQASGVAPEATLYVGDNYEHDVLGPLRVGMHAAWLKKGPEPEESCASVIVWAIKPDSETQRRLEAQSARLARARNLRIMCLPDVLQVEQRLDAWRI